jgi:membrane protease YdiL (CAAX protease family)
VVAGVAPASPAAGVAAAAAGAEPAVRQVVLYRMNLWAGTLAFPFQAAAFPLLFGSVSGTRPEQLGLTRRRLGRNVLAGVVGALLLLGALVQLPAHIDQALGQVVAHSLQLSQRQHPRPAGGAGGPEVEALAGE